MRISSLANISVVAEGGEHHDSAAQAISPDIVFCRSCGQQMLAASEICPACSETQIPKVPVRREKSSPIASLTGILTGNLLPFDRFTAAYLSFFLASLGAHKFYLKDNKKGALYVLFAWTFIPAILGVVQATRFVFMSDEKFATKFVPEL